MNPKDQYVVPELKLVGQTSDVVFGSLGFGEDFAGEILVPDMEFAAD
jgi:hypothetical protein